MGLFLSFEAIYVTVAPIVTTAVMSVKGLAGNSVFSHRE